MIFSLLVFIVVLAFDRVLHTVETQEDPSLNILPNLAFLPLISFLQGQPYLKFFQ